MKPLTIMDESYLEKRYLKENYWLDDEYSDPPEPDYYYGDIEIDYWETLKQALPIAFTIDTISDTYTNTYGDLCILIQSKDLVKKEVPVYASRNRYFTNEYGDEYCDVIDVEDETINFMDLCDWILEPFIINVGGKEYIYDITGRDNNSVDGEILIAERDEQLTEDQIKTIVDEFNRNALNKKALIVKTT